MQTFLPYPDFSYSAKCLDMRRLGKQRVEALQILQTLEIGRGSWINHPAVRMWKGYSHALALYGQACIMEWKKRGYKNNISLVPYFRGPVKLPPWLGDDRLHSSHRSQLLKKKPEFYSQYGWEEEPGMPYFWPV